MEDLVAGIKLMLVPNESGWSAMWNAMNLERVALNNKNQMNKLTCGQSPLALVLQHICKERPESTDIVPVVNRLRSYDTTGEGQLKMSHMTNYEWLRGKAGKENADIALAIYLVALGSSVQFALITMDHGGDVVQRFPEMLQLLNRVEILSQQKAVERDVDLMQMFVRNYLFFENL